MAKVKFLKSPTASPYFMGYSVGEIGEVSDPKKVKAMVNDGICELLSKPKKVTKKKDAGSSK